MNRHYDINAVSRSQRTSVFVLCQYLVCDIIASGWCGSFHGWFGSYLVQSHHSGRQNFKTDSSYFLLTLRPVVYGLVFYCHAQNARRCYTYATAHYKAAPYAPTSPFLLHVFAFERRARQHAVPFYLLVPRGSPAWRQQYFSLPSQHSSSAALSSHSHTAASAWLACSVAWISFFLRKSGCVYAPLSPRGFAALFCIHSERRAYLPYSFLYTARSPLAHALSRCFRHFVRSGTPRCLPALFIMRLLTGSCQAHAPLTHLL